jgi:hypothetical protein
MKLTPEQWMFFPQGDHAAQLRWLQNAGIEAPSTLAKPKQPKPRPLPPTRRPRGRGKRVWGMRARNPAGRSARAVATGPLRFSTPAFLPQSASS